MSCLSFFLRPLFFTAVVCSSSFPPRAEEPSGKLEENFPDGPTIPVDAKLEQLVKRAEQFADDDRFDLAIAFWNRSLREDAGGILLTDESKISKMFQGHRYLRYRALDVHIAEQIAKNEQAVRAFRMACDEEAQALLKDVEGWQLKQAQARVARELFVTSGADEAALDLAKTRLGHGEYSASRRLLAPLVERYPKPDIDLDEARKLLAAATAGIEDNAAGRKQVSEILGKEPTEPRHKGPWAMAFGQPDRTGSFPALPKEAIQKPLASAWSVGSLVQPVDQNVPRRLRRFYPPQADTWPKLPSSDTSPSTDLLLQAWKNNRWQPTARVCISDGRIYYRGHGRVACRDSETGELQWLGRVHRPPVDSGAPTTWNMQDDSLPQKSDEIEYFGNRAAAASMTIVGGSLFCLEGELGKRQPRAPQPSHGCLHAYDATNGKFIWQAAIDLPRERPEVAPAETPWPTGFISGPTPYLDWLLVPAINDGDLWLYALAQKDGSIVWKRLLCGTRSMLANPWSSPAVAVAEGDVYVATGLGVVFALDALTGRMHWATRYSRALTKGERDELFPILAESRQLSGWDDNSILVYGKHVVVLPSDADLIVSIDQHDGRLLWESPRNLGPSIDNADRAGRYLLGVAAGKLYVAGNDVLRAYSLNSGRLDWQAPVDDVYARGVLTADAIYLPGEDQIYRLDAKTGEQTDVIKVTLPVRSPLGNLYSDGKRLISVGPWRLHVLGNLDDTCNLLQKRIDKGDTQARWQRLRILSEAGQIDVAIAGLQALFDDLSWQDSMDAHAALIRNMDELRLADRQPLLAMAMLTQASGKLTENDIPISDLEEIERQRNNVLTTILQAVATQKPDGAIAVLVQASPWLKRPYLRRRAARTIATVAREEDLDVLRAALESPVAAARALVCVPLAAIADEPAAMLGPRLHDKDEQVRLAAAQGLATHANRGALAPLVKLLESKEVEVRAESCCLLRGMTGESFRFTPYGDKTERADATERWKTWLTEHGKTAELRKMPFAPVMLGRTLISYYAQNKVLELDRDGKITWEANIPYAWGCQGLPNGHRVVASYSGRFVAEFDDEGRKVWQRTGLPGAPFSVRRLENGNTLVTCSDSQQVIEIAPDKSTAWEVKLAGRPMDAQRLDNGNTLIVLQTAGKVVEINRAGKIVWQVGGQDSVLAASRLDNGNTLICQQTRNRVVEVNRDGEVVWSQGDFHSPYDAQRLPDGSTLVVDYHGVREINPEGEVVWKRAGKGASRIHRY